MIYWVHLRKEYMDYKEKPSPYWEHRDWYKARNKQIYQDRKDDTSWRMLMDKYDLSLTRLRGIFNKLEGSENGSN